MSNKPFLSTLVKKTEKLEENVTNLTEEIAFKTDAYGLPMLYLTGDTTGMTKDDTVDLAYVYGELSGTASVKWQGSSSLKWPKKNYTIKFDNAFEVVEGWGAQKKYCFKANFIDFSHARNVVSGKLWGKVVKSRVNVSDKLSALPNGGAIDGFPCIIMLNGKFHGLYTWNIPKDGWMYGMDNGSVQTETEKLAFDTYVEDDPESPADGEYTSSTAVQAFSIFNRSTLSGGRLRVNWDVNKLNNFNVLIHLYDETGALVKNFCGHDDTTLNPYYQKVSGDLGDDAWLDVGTRADSIKVSGPFSLPIPEGYTAFLHLALFAGTYTMPDGTLSSQWVSGMSETEWVMTWIKTGIEVSVEAYTYQTYENGAIFGADTTSQPTCFKALATLTGDFDIEYVPDEDNADWALTSLNRLIAACINSDGTDLNTTIAQYLDWDSAIDYYIFACLIGGADMAGKNYLLYTYDGTKWAFGAYDMDSTFGLWWDGTKFLRENTYPTIKWYADYHKAMNLIYYYKKDAFKARYAELRAGALSEGSIAEAFSNFIAKIPSSVYAADAQKWPTIPSTAANNLNQILNWYRLRVAVLDKEVETM